MTGSRPRVLFVGAFPPARGVVFGGMVTSCGILLESSFSSRLDLDLLDSTQISNPPPGLAVRLVLAARRFMRFIRRFEQRPPDAVLLFVAVGASIVEKGAMAWYARLRRVPVVILPRGWSVVEDCRSSAFARTWVRWAFRGARTLVCQSEAWRRFAIDVLGFASSNVTVIRNWTATRELLDLGASRNPRQEAPVRLLFLGWLERDKGIFELIEACRRLAAGRQFTLDVAGEGSVSAATRTLVERYDLGHTIRFRGWLHGSDLRRALREADVFVLPSWAEGLPNAMVEAMAARLAVVVTPVGAIPELITDHGSGLLVECGNPDSLTGALAEIIDDGELRARLAEEGHRIAARDFEVEAVVNRLVEEIETTILAGRERRFSGRAP